MMPTITVKQTSIGEYHFYSDIPSRKSIFLLQSPLDSTEQLLLQTQQTDFTITINNLPTRAYFYVQLESGTGFVVAERTLLISGMNNFRDLGGYQTIDNKNIIWGKLYRSDHLFNANPEGLDLLKTLGVHSIIDYRSPNERRKYPNKVFDTNVKTFCLDPDAHTAELAAQFTAEKDNEDINLVHKILEQKENGKLTKQHDIVIQQYQNFVAKPQCQEAFSCMLKIAAREENIALLQHCRGGKDRTGFGVMLLLAILGVPQETIIADYMLTHTNRLARNQFKMARYRQLTEDPIILAYLYSLIDTKPDFIQASINKIIADYDSIENYARDVLQISTAEIQQLKNLYLQ